MDRGSVTRRPGAIPESGPNGAGTWAPFETHLRRRGPVEATNGTPRRLLRSIPGLAAGFSRPGRKGEPGGAFRGGPPQELGPPDVVLEKSRRFGNLGQIRSMAPVPMGKSAGIDDLVGPPPYWQSRL